MITIFLTIRRQDGRQLFGDKMSRGFIFIIIIILLTFQVVVVVVIVIGGALASISKCFRGVGIVMVIAVVMVWIHLVGR